MSDVLRTLRCLWNLSVEQKMPFVARITWFGSQPAPEPKKHDRKSVRIEIQTMWHCRCSIGWIRQRQAEAKRPPKFVLGGRAWREPPKHLIYIYVSIYILISHHKDLENIMTMTVLQLSLSAQCHLPIKAVANARCYPRLDKEKPVWPLLWWDEQVSRHLLSFPRAIPSPTLNKHLPPWHPTSLQLSSMTNWPARPGSPRFPTTCK